jgi:hypothetical protein
MNERMVELIWKCIVPADQADDYCKSNKLFVADEKLDVEKFAELIAKECIDIVKAGINNAEHWDSSYWDQACENRAWAIQKHFGVKL